MQWLLTLETDGDPITSCRIMNIFRRKGVKIVTLSMSAGTSSTSVMAVVETAEGEVEHMFNFLRSTGGVEHVTCYRHEASADACYVFVNAGSEASNPSRFLQSFPEAKLVFGSHGKYLLEIPAEGGLMAGTPPRVAGFGETEFLSFACIRSTRTSPSGLMSAAN